MIFYACAFPLMYEIAITFVDVRYALHHAGFLLRLAPAELAAAGIFLSVMAILIAAFFWRRARSNSVPSEISSLPDAALTQPKPS